MRNVLLVVLCSSLLSIGGCSSIDPAVLQALANDDASVCFTSDIRGGAGAIAGVPTAGYGQATLALCRSKKDNAKIEVKPDGTISIEHK